MGPPSNLIGQQTMLTILCHVNAYSGPDMSEIILITSNRSLVLIENFSKEIGRFLGRPRNVVAILEQNLKCGDFLQFTPLSHGSNGNNDCSRARGGDSLKYGLYIILDLI